MADKRTVAVLAVVTGATLFGFLGVPNRYFQTDLGLNSMDVTVIRFTSASISLLIILGIFARDQLKIGWRNVPYLVLTGIFKLLCDMFLFFSQQTISLSLSSLLQMTAPYYVMLVSFFIFGEKLTIRKISCMILGSFGCVLVTGVLFGRVDANVDGILAAMASGLLYGLFVVGNKMNMDKGVSPAATLFYALLLADLLALPLINVDSVVDSVSSLEGIAMAVALGLFLSVIPFYLYNWSLNYLEPTVSSTVAVLETASSSVVGFFLYDETLGPEKILGMAFVMLSIVLLNISFSKKVSEKYDIDPHTDTMTAVSKIPMDGKKKQRSFP